MSPNLKGFENGDQFLVMDIVVEFRWHEGAGVGGNGVDFIVCQGNHGEDGSKGVVWNKMPVEISEPQEGLYGFNLVGLRPILNDLDFIGCHGKFTWREDVT